MGKSFPSSKQRKLVKACSSKWSLIGKLLGKSYLSFGFSELKPSLSLRECEGVSVVAYDVAWEVLSRWVYGKTVDEEKLVYDADWDWDRDRDRDRGWERAMV